MKMLEGKVALVTGGTRGIGKAIVLAFADEGAHVAFTYAGSTDKAAEIENSIKEKGGWCMAIQADATDFNKAQQVIDLVIEQRGELHIVVNNAGITRDNLLLRMTEAHWDEVIDANLKSVFNYTKAASKQMIKQRAGCFINLSSVVGVGGNAGQANYAASKAGIIGFTKSIAKELASRNIRANVVAPGFIATEMTEKMPEAELKKWIESIPMGRAGTAAEVAQLCVFLASDRAAYITGEVIQIDGGMN
jgi:3-oxoacyl-[acyl-carrier protein] reductase